MSGIKKTKSYTGEATVLIFLCWLVYSTSYLGKVNYSANITKIIDYYNVSKAEAGMAPTFFFFAYGIGQVVNGLLCKRYNIKWMIFGSLTLSAIINLIIGTSSNFEIIKWLWMLNGFTLSVLWPTLIRLLSENLPEKDLSRSSVAMGTTVATGTLVIYGLSSLYALFDKFTLAFYTAGGAGITVALFWLLMYKKVAGTPKTKIDTAEKEKTHIAEKQNQTKNENRLLIISVCVLCFCAVGINLIKDGLITWVPSILKDEFSLNDSISILLTVFLPIVAIFGNLCALAMHKKIPDYVMHCCSVFAAIFIVIGIVVGSLGMNQIALTLIGMVVANFLAASLNSLVTGIYPIFMREKINSGLIAGVINGFCYLGSTISSYGLGIIADGFGWNAVFYFLMGFSFVICLVCLGYYIVKRTI